MSFARRLAKRSIGRWVWLETYHCMRLPWEHAQAAAAPADGLHFRLIERAELAPYGNERQYDFSALFLQGLASRDDLCFGAFASGKLVSYCFFALMATAIDSYLRFHFPQRWIYAYKAFTHPSWRGKRLQQQVFLQALPEIGRWVRGIRDPLGFVTLVVTENVASLNAFTRLGFMPFESFPVLRIASRPRLFSGLAEKSRAFYIETTAEQG